MNKSRLTRSPQKGDLIYIKRPTTGVLTIGDPFKEDTSKAPKSWSTGLIMLEPNQTALVLKVYNIDKKKTDLSSSTLVEAQQLINDYENDNKDKDKDPQIFCILTVSIGNHVVETLYDPNYLDVITTPSN